MLNPDQIKSRREAIGISRYGLAKRANIDQRTIARAEAGEKVLGISLNRIEIALVEAERAAASI